MKKIAVIGVVWVVAITASRGAEEMFSKAVRAEEFAAAGLAKLSPDELGRLDALVRDYRNAALAAVPNAAAVMTGTRSKGDPKPEAAARKAEGGIFSKAKVVVTPGTEVEVGALESRIAGDFTGWEGRTVFKLENGQRWQIANSSSYYTPKSAGPKVKIVPATMGGYWMLIEGVATRVKVVPVKAK